MHRFLQHVLPPDRHRVRYYGWMHPGARARRCVVETLLSAVIAVRTPRGEGSALAPALHALRCLCPRQRRPDQAGLADCAKGPDDRATGGGAIHLKLALLISFSAWTELNPVRSSGGAWVSWTETRYSEVNPPPFYRRRFIAGVFDHALRDFGNENDPISGS